MAYASTPNKRTIRTVWDRAILEGWQRERGKPLTYFGLPGPEIHDFIDWKDLLHSQRTAVESPGRTKSQRESASDTMGRLSTNVLVHGVSSGFQLLRADVEDVIINGIDRDGNPPQINDGRPVHVMRFGYDLVNLDFDGGIGYRNAQGEAPRLTAIRRLFHRQEDHDFILFLTVNVRHTLGDEIEGYLEGIKSRHQGTHLAELMNWYLGRGNGELEYKLKVAVPCFIHAIAHPCRFRSICRPPIVYEGHKRARMMHFAFELTSCKSNFPAFSSQDDSDLASLPLVRCSEGKLSLALQQHPGFDLAQALHSLNFLPSDGVEIPNAVHEMYAGLVKA